MVILTRRISLRSAKLVLRKSIKDTENDILRRSRPREKEYRAENREHYKELYRDWYANNKTNIAQRREDAKRQIIERMGGKCTRCGYSEHYVALQFDHIDPEEKVVALSNWLGLVNLPHESLETELAKCQLLCANCHQIRTHRPKDF